MFKQLKQYLQSLALELTVNGKSLVIWLTNEIPGLTDYPGLIQALQELVSNPTMSSFLHFLFQAAWAGASGHRLIKVLLGAAQRKQKIF